MQYYTNTLYQRLLSDKRGKFHTWCAEKNSTNFENRVPTLWSENSDRI